MTVRDGSIRVGRGRLLVGDREVPLMSGEVQYWRTRPSAWPTVLDRVVELGLPLVSTYLSWRRHEPEQGRLFWGEDDPALDLRRFLRLCAERNLLVQVKPGPWICAEETAGGYPDWLLARGSDLALGANGRPCLGYNTPFEHPVPSMHAPGYLAAARQWLGSVWQQIGDFAWPDGPVIAVQLDNEPSMAFQDALYFADYHPQAIDTFRAWLTDRYNADVTAWQQAWGDAATDDFRLAEPPRPDVNLLGGQELMGSVAAPTPVSAAADRDWLTFIEDSLVEHLEALRRVHEDSGMGHLLTTVNLIPNVIHEAPLRHRRVRERLGEGVAVGVDHYYDPPMSWALVSCLARTAAAARAAGEPLVWAPEMMAGIWRSPGEVVDYPDPTPQEQAAWWGSAMALGYKGFNFYMLVDRENWALAPISASGELTAFADPLRRLAALLAACPAVLEAQPFTSVTVATYRPYLLDAHTTVGTMRQPVVPWAEPARREAYDAWDGLVSALVEHSIGYELWDTEEPAPPPGSQVLIPDGAPIPDEALDRLASSGCRVLHLRADVDFATIPGIQGAVRVVAPDPDTKILAAVHVTDDNVHLLHLVRWGGGVSTSGGWLEVATSGWAEGAWREEVDGQTLAGRPEGGWFIPSFTGHMVFRWVTEAT